MSIVRNSLAVVAASAVLALTSACGGGADKVALCTEATKAMTDYQTAAAAAGANFEGLNKATADFAAKLKDLGGKADGDLQSALTKFGDSFADLKIDPSDSSAATKVTEFAQKVSEAGAAFGTACS
ncbi:hypothetical protein [Microtetraspora sp. NBRC 16547]|uniref:hypothetical protein n=1 Tax=Microtetraspora sp. NBRC 16547 TaxID=3030993 RepID=UPI0024A00347|nr:hypothetical protein [Microtetraspora sp. NBRC 16547]GLX00151.1 hypothetical protein Misp02_42370 [Microtetraspora sp. NBRC 16547]